MSTVPLITDGNTFANKTVDTPPVGAGQETLVWAIADANALKARAGEAAVGINDNQAQITANLKAAVQAPHTTATLVLTDAMANFHTPLDASSNAIAIDCPETLAVGTGLSFSVIDISNPITIAPSGTTGFEMSFTGKSLIDALGDIVTVLMESATRVRVTIAPRDSTTVVP